MNIDTTISPINPKQSTLFLALNERTSPLIKHQTYQITAPNPKEAKIPNIPISL